MANKMSVKIIGNGRDFEKNQHQAFANQLRTDTIHIEDIE